MTPGIAFTETMDGWIHFGEDSKTLDFQRATLTAKSRGEYARFFLSARSWNTHNRKPSPTYLNLLPYLQKYT